MPRTLAPAPRRTEARLLAPLVAQVFRTLPNFERLLGGRLASLLMTSLRAEKAVEDEVPTLVPAHSPPPSFTRTSTHAVHRRLSLAHHG